MAKSSPFVLKERPAWRDRAVMAVLVNPSRETIDSYRALRVEIERTCDRINERFGSGDRLPVVLDARDDFARSLGGLVRADVLFVNPIKDGLNLVAKEGPTVNERDAPLCLSRDAGAFDELGDDCVPVQPYDLVQTARALETALTMPADERRRRAESLRARIGARTRDATVLPALLDALRSQPGRFRGVPWLSPSAPIPPADFDEMDVWRLRPEAKAQAFVRGNPQLSAPLQFVAVEPLMIPKRSLSGSSREQVDTRVLQVIYSVDSQPQRLYVGQQLDVFLEVTESEQANRGESLVVPLPTPR